MPGFARPSHECHGRAGTCRVARNYHCGTTDGSPMRSAMALMALLALCVSASANPTPVDRDLLALSQAPAAPAASETTMREAQYLRASSPQFSGQVFYC